MNFRDKAVDKSTEIAMCLTQTEIEKPRPAHTQTESTCPPNNPEADEYS